MGKHEVKQLTLDRVTLIIFGILFVTTIISALALINTRVSAETTTVSDGNKSATASVNVNAACTMSTTGNIDSSSGSASIGDTNTHTATLTPGTWTSDIGLTHVTTVCNDSLGYAIYAIGYSNNTYGNTNLINNADTNNPITILTGTATSGNTSSWSMKLASGAASTASPSQAATIVTTPTNYTTYAPIPNTYTKVATYPTSTTISTTTTDTNTNTTSTTTGQTGTSLTTTYGVYVSPTQTPGTYTGAVRYTLVHPSNAIPQNKYYMQDFTIGQCEVLAHDAPIEVVDKRDNEVYKVQYLKDGNCWMLDNLRLGSNDHEIPLSPLDTNIKEPWVLPKSGTECFSNDFCMNTSGAIGTGMTVPAINSSYKDDVGVVSFGHGSGRMWVYYNYCALSGGTYCYSWNQGADNAGHDICPSKWRLPAGGGNGEFQYLYVAYNNDATSFNGAFSTVLSGSFSSEGQINLGKRGIFPSSTNYNGSLMYGLYVQSSTVAPTDYLTGDRYRFVGNTVRCLLDR